MLNTSDGSAGSKSDENHDIPLSLELDDGAKESLAKQLYNTLQISYGLNSPADFAGFISQLEKRDKTVDAFSIELLYEYFYDNPECRNPNGLNIFYLFPLIVIKEKIDEQFVFQALKSTETKYFTHENPLTAFYNARFIIYIAPKAPWFAIYITYKHLIHELSRAKLKQLTDFLIKVTQNNRDFISGIKAELEKNVECLSFTEKFKLKQLINECTKVISTNSEAYHSNIRTNILEIPEHLAFCTNDELINIADDIAYLMNQEEFLNFDLQNEDNLFFVLIKKCLFSHSNNQKFIGYLCDKLSEMTVRRYNDQYRRRDKHEDDILITLISMIQDPEALQFMEKLLNKLGGGNYLATAKNKNKHNILYALFRTQSCKLFPKFIDLFFKFANPDIFFDLLNESINGYKTIQYVIKRFNSNNDLSPLERHYLISSINTLLGIIQKTENAQLKLPVGLLVKSSTEELQKSSFYKVHSRDNTILSPDQTIMTLSEHETELKAQEERLRTRYEIELKAKDDAYDAVIRSFIEMKRNYEREIAELKQKLLSKEQELKEAHVHNNEPELHSETFSPVPSDNFVEPTNPAPDVNGREENPNALPAASTDIIPSDPQGEETKSVGSPAASEHKDDKESDGLNNGDSMDIEEDLNASQLNDMEGTMQSTASKNASIPKRKASELDDDNQQDTSEEESSESSQPPTKQTKIAKEKEALEEEEEETSSIEDKETQLPAIESVEVDRIRFFRRYISNNKHKDEISKDYPTAPIKLEPFIKPGEKKFNAGYFSEGLMYKALIHRYTGKILDPKIVTEDSFVTMEPKAPKTNESKSPGKSKLIKCRTFAVSGMHKEHKCPYSVSVIWNNPASNVNHDMYIEKTYPDGVPVSKKDKKERVNVRFIEVKGTGLSLTDHHRNAQFTRNELQLMAIIPNQYRFYRLYNINNKDLTTSDKIKTYKFTVNNVLNINDKDISAQQEILSATKTQLNRAPAIKSINFSL